MLVHKFYLVECIQVEFKFELNSNRFEWKQESESVILSFLSHSRSLSFLSHSFLSLSHSFCSQSFLIFSVIPYILSHSFFSQSFSFFPQLFLLSRSFPQLDPTCRPLLPRRSTSPEISGELPRLGPARQWDRRRPTKSSPQPIRTLTLAPASPRGPPAPPPVRRSVLAIPRRR
jgi:hypothetical protein